MGSARRCTRTTASETSFDREHTLRRPRSPWALLTFCVRVVAQNEPGDTRSVENKPAANQHTTRTTHPHRRRRPTRPRVATRRRYGLARDRFPAEPCRTRCAFLHPCSP
ncbi:hypothetical protein L226DRAFT_209765 [Lentinus tigrinus ALCF2SS1-7]|uniref:uncharacterized protein n=1 Tax=Lentinus tigrinus ALCF2SS1-7 TaxID=1328758 RepID=UPI0011660EEB|nr:hypothetical protein L226DRAFT_209765 [Lentinus tigrinus ALCF2SS1-7]